MQLFSVLGIFIMEDKHQSITICPRHRAKYGIRWRSGKVTCAVPMEIAAHRSKRVKGAKPLLSKEALYILNTTGKLFELDCVNCHIMKRLL